MPPLNAYTRFLLLGIDFADNMSATAALTPYESNRGRGGGCLGFFVHSFSLGKTIRGSLVIAIHFLAYLNLSLLTKRKYINIKTSIIGTRTKEEIIGNF
jgi:hypothetical protein